MTWEATAEAINALPEPVRQWIHDLETRCDPAGDLRSRRIAEDAADATRRENINLRAVKNNVLERACIALRIPATDCKELNLLIAQAERRDIAAMAMQGLLSADKHVADEYPIGACSQDSIKTADPLLAELAKKAT